MLNCTTGLLPCVFEGRNCTQFPYITSQSSVSWRIALWDCLETSLPLCLMNLDPVSLRNSAVVGIVANCTMGLFGDVITSSIDLSRIYLGGQRLFSRGFRFLCGFGLRPTPKIPVVRDKNLWCPGYPAFRSSEQT